MRRVEVLHDDVRHPARRRHIRDKLLQGLESAGGGAKTHDPCQGRLVRCRIIRQRACIYG